jgi:hypothetical protein
MVFKETRKEVESSIKYIINKIKKEMTEYYKTIIHYN